MRLILFTFQGAPSIGSAAFFLSVFIIAQLLENASPKTKGHRLWAVPFSVPPGWGQDFCKRQINYMALYLQALPTALHHVKARSAG